MSIFQFSFDLSTKLSVKIDSSKKHGLLTRLKNVVFGTEAWAFLFVFLVQDLPFAILRLSVIINYEKLSKNYTLYFFVVKNLILGKFFTNFKILVILRSINIYFFVPACCEVYYVGLIFLKEEEKEEEDEAKVKVVPISARSNYYGEETNV